MHRTLCLLSLLSGCVEPEVAEVAEALSTRVGPNVRVSDDATSAAQNQPAASSVRPGHLLIAAHSYPPGATSPVDGVAAFWRSADGGRTFPTRGVVPGLDRAHGGAFQGASDLALACAPTGDCYLAAFVYDLAISRTAIAVSRSSDGGATWRAPVLVIDETDPALFNERCAIAVSGTSVYVTWIRVEGGGAAVPIYAAASHDRGATWSAPRAISDPAEDLLNNKPAIAVDRAGRVVVVYENYLLDDPERDRHLVQVSRDGGATFSPARPIDYVFDTFEPLPPAHFRHNSFPALAIDPIGDALLVAWTDTRNGGPDVLVARSTDTGATWSTPRRVTDTPVGAAVQHAFPALACNAIGVCGVSFYSSRNDPGAVLLDTYFAPIVAGRPGPNIRISDVPMDPDTQFGGTFIGDYTALVIDTAAHPVWTDTRVGAQQDIFTARLTVGP